MIPTWGVQGFWESYQGLEFIKFAQLGLYRGFYLEDSSQLQYVVNNHGFVLAGFYTRSSNFIGWVALCLGHHHHDSTLAALMIFQSPNVFGMTTFGFNFHIYPLPQR